ncbi:MAG TPA: Clp protease N-terminal domain-containing protein [Planctomycetota bacterium]|nr:Clp protease N-terminal domain-containing protein [Planctomycetota bacterium]
MPNRLTQAVLTAIGLARAEARARNHSWLGTEHVLVALSTHGNTNASEVFCRLGLRHERMREGLGKISALGNGPRVVALATTPRLKSCVKKASKAASDLGRTAISTALVLLAIVSEQDSAASAILRALEIDRSLFLGTILDVAREPADEEERLVAESLSQVYMRDVAPLPAIPIMAPPLYVCPRGHGPMQKLRFQALEVGLCQECLGTFVPAGALEKLVDLAALGSLERLFNPA